MVPLYAYTTDDDKIAWDAMIVGIGDPALIAAGMTQLKPLANIYWPYWIQGYKINASLEGPYHVPEVLEHAKILCALWA